MNEMEIFHRNFHRNFHGNEDQRFSMNDCNKCKNVEEWKSDFRRLEILEKSEYLIFSEKYFIIILKTQTQ